MESSPSNAHFFLFSSPPPQNVLPPTKKAYPSKKNEPFAQLCIKKHPPLYGNSFRLTLIAHKKCWANILLLKFETVIKYGRKNNPQ